MKKLLTKIISRHLAFLPCRTWPDLL